MCADTFLYVQNQPSTLAGAGSNIGATSIILSSFTTIDGTALVMTNFGTIGFGTLEPGNGTQEEQIAFTGITQNANGTATLTGVSTVLFISPYTQSSGTTKTHVGGSTFVVSNTAGFYDKLTSKGDDETITGTYTFTNPNYPRMDTQTPAPTDPQQLVTKSYADGLAIAGAPNASTSVQGLVQEATQAQVDAKTATGSTGAKLFQNLSTQRSTLLSDYVADTGAANAYVITPSPAITAYIVGQQFSFKATNANTTTSTLNVSGLGVKTIKNSQGNNLVANDIISGQIIDVEYDGTNFQMLNISGRGYVGLSGAETVAGVKTFSSSPVAPTPSGSTDVAIKSYVDGNPITWTNGISSKDTTDASTTQTIAHGLGRTPKMVYVRFHSSLGTTLQETYLDVFYNGTTIAINGLSGDGTTSLSVVSSTSNSIVLNDINTGGRFQTGVMSIDSTNISIVWTKTATPVRVYSIIWQAT